VVPPIYEKNTRYHALLSPIWEQASQLLESADAVVVFGYSLPPTDVAARRLIQRALHKNATLGAVSIIDIDPWVVPRLSGIVPLRSIYYHDSVPALAEAGEEAFV
jgi:hypothetical protein